MNKTLGDRMVEALLVIVESEATTPDQKIEASKLIVEIRAHQAAGTMN